MKKCPIKPKTSDLDPPAERKASGKPNYLSPTQLARLLGPLKRQPGRKPRNRSERTVREYCKSGQISEAYKTKGGHWRIRMPLSMKTRYELEKRRADWPFKGQTRDLQGDFEEDFAERLSLAQLYQLDVHKRVPVLYLAELGDDSLPESIKQPVGKKERSARRIQDLIIERLDAGKSCSDLLLRGWVYQFWRNNKCRPTVAEIAQLMGMSRDTFYRHGHTNREIERAYVVASGESKRELPDPLGLDPVQRANRKAKKATFASLQRDLYSDD